MTKNELEKLEIVKNFYQSIGSNTIHFVKRRFSNTVCY